MVQHNAYDKQPGDETSQLRGGWLQQAVGSLGTSWVFNGAPNMSGAALQHAANQDLDPADVVDVVQPDRPGLYTETGLTVIEEIPSDQVEALRAMDERIRYVPLHAEDLRFGHKATEQARIQPDGQSGVAGMFILDDEQEYAASVINSFGIGGNVFNGYVEPYLREDLEAFMLKRGLNEVAVRGIQCSIGDSIEETVGPYSVEMKVQSAADIMANGVDGRGVRTMVTYFGRDEYTKSDELPELHHRTNQWLVNHPQETRRRLAGHPDEAINVFPMLLVYDPDKLQRTDGNQYSVQPQDGLTFNDALIAAYVLPYAASTPRRYSPLG